MCIPAHNEAKTVGIVVRSVLSTRVLDKICALVTCDRCTDNTETEARRAGAITYRTPPDTKGLADVFRFEMKKALSHNPDVIVHVDADGQYMGFEMWKLINALKNSDLVLGNRLQYGRPNGMPLSKYFGNKLGSFAYSILLKTPIPDITTGFRAMNPAVAKLQLEAQYTYTQEQVYRAVQNGMRVISVPVTFLPRQDGKSRLIKNSLQYIRRSVIDLKRMRDNACIVNRPR